MARPPSTFVWDDRFLDYDFGSGHPFSERYRELAVRLLESLGPDFGTPIEWVRSVPPTERSALERFHRPEYLDFVEESGLAEFSSLLDQGDTPAFPGCYEASARLVAGALRALSATRERRVPSFHPAGGLHHAHPDRASGFCVFNDVAIAIAAALHDGLSVAYVDIDAHHGDGVMYGFYSDGRLLDIDVHQDGRTLFPGTGAPTEIGAGDGAGLKVNLPLPPLAGDAALLALIRRVAIPLLRDFGPDLIVLQHGVDGHVGDPLTHLQYTPAAYAVIDRTLLDLANELTSGRVLVTGGGGYRPESVSRVLATAGLVFGGSASRAPGEELPVPWRHQFEAVTGVAAPRTWADSRAPVRSPWTADDENALVASLERSLGRRFPAEPG